jgi:hypothetical protein
LDQSIVVSKLIPRVKVRAIAEALCCTTIANSFVIKKKAEWEELSKRVFSGQIDIRRLEKVFSGLQSESQLKEELSLMVSSLVSDPSITNTGFSIGSTTSSITKLTVSSSNVVLIGVMNPRGFLGERKKIDGQ